MGLSFWGPDGKWYGTADAYPEGLTGANTPKGVIADVLRRYVLALGGTAAVSVTVTGLGELAAELGGHTPEPLPSQLFEVHVAQVRDLTQRLWEAGKAYGANPEASSAMAGLSDATAEGAGH